MPWMKKFAPRSSLDVPQQAAVTRLKNFVQSYGVQKKRAVLIHGPPGSCKTSSVYAIAEELGYDVLELNASDTRNAESITSVLGGAARQMSLFSRGKIILVDEVDGIAGAEDRGGLAAMVDIIELSAFPIVLTANDPWESKFSSLRRKCEVIEFNKLNYRLIVNVLKKVCEHEKIIFDEEALVVLAKGVDGDLRSAINDVQSVAVVSGEVTMRAVESVSMRDREESVLQALGKVFKGMNVDEALQAFDNVKEDLDKCMLWVEENLPFEYDGESLVKGFDWVSKASVFRGRIVRWQYWRLLVYMNALLSAGVMVSKKERSKKFVSYKQTSRILKLWMAKQKYQKRKSVGEKLAEVTHTSVRRCVQDTLPFVQLLFQREKGIARELVRELDLQEEEIVWLEKKR